MVILLQHHVMENEFHVLLSQKISFAPLGILRDTWTNCGRQQSPQSDDYSLYLLMYMIITGIFVKYITSIVVYH